MTTAVPDSAKHMVATELKNIEEALKYLPEESEACRSARIDLLEKQKKLKQESMEHRPLGTQLDGVQGAIERSRKRLQAATDAATEAQKLIATEEANIARLTAEKVDIEAKIRKSVGSAAPPSTSELSQQLHAMHQKMESKPGMPVETLNAARTQMESLLAGLEAALQVEEEEEAKAATGMTKDVFKPAAKDLRLNHSDPERGAQQPQRARTQPSSDVAMASADGQSEFPLDWATHAGEDT